ncbi:bifunctional adenosylcobinamide kinase/adenosylcobinamide-phosphate guanylyltransferase [uncultured Bartonella sp.]|uniref:bifunctional adenosylcobinamide kinase/adenosylcobinamide-phosphate guanylyltransferase n=1 Tax=uncultured Bartonella sp. TaxID=104108 RepID=UPI00262CF872|nr:bifunctional adenosylcobinamide kinase/adenosylcobinamide-phosphate guanylyltransferase [uncultured Bartonella sp.]
MSKITLVLGGTRSGKSVFAENYVLSTQKQPVYLATAEIFNEEMKKRIKTHQSRRQSIWINVEEPVDILKVLQHHNSVDKIVLVDCLSVWLGNLIEHHLDPEQEMANLVDGLASIEVETVIVASEVGLGIVPENRLAREFSDYAGALNQKIAAIAANVFFVAAGLPLRLKG